MSVAIRTATRIQDMDDANVTPAAGVDGYALLYDNATQKFVLSGSNPAHVLEVATSGRTYTNIQTAINAASAGDVVLIHPGTYSLASGTQLLLKNGVDLFGIGQPIILRHDSQDGPTVTDGAGVVACNLSNLIIRRTKPSGSPTTAYGLHLQTSGTSISCANVVVNSDIAQGILTATGTTLRGARGTSTASSGIGNAGSLYDSTGESSVAMVGGIHNGGLAIRCTGLSTGGYGFFNVGGAGFAQNCIGRSSGGNTAFMNYSQAIACSGYSTAAGMNGFETSSSEAGAAISIGCAGWSTTGPGYSAADLTTSSALASTNINCSGYSDSNVGFYVNSTRPLVKCVGCFGASRTATGFYQLLGICQNCAGQSEAGLGYSQTAGYAFGCSGRSEGGIAGYLLSGGIAHSCTGATLSAGADANGFTVADAVAVNCTGRTASTNSYVGGLGTSHANSKLIGCSAISETGAAALYIATAGARIIGGSYSNKYDNAAGHAVRVGATGTALAPAAFFRNVSTSVVHASAWDYTANGTGTYGDFLGCVGTNGIFTTRITQTATETPDAQGNLWG